MFWNIILLIILVVWIIIYLKNKKVILSLPYLLMIFLTPIYNILDQKIFVEIFGCGCVPSAQTNMFNIDFNANDLRLIVYNILAIFITFLGLFLSRNIESKKLKIIYVLTILVFNSLLAYTICQLYMWA
jgi:hypothetical protein